MKIKIYKIKECLSYFEGLSVQVVYDENSCLESIQTYDMLVLEATDENMEIAKEAREKHSMLNVLFIAEDERFAYKAFQLNASGYLINPDKEAIQNALENIRYGVYSNVKFQCFGKFDILSQGESVFFKRKKAKEMLAYLINQRGETVPIEELCNVLFKVCDKKKRTYIYVLKVEINKALMPYGLENVVLCANSGFSLDNKKVDCDYYRYLDGKKDLYKGEYMSQYSWAEKTRSMLAEER